MRDRDSRLFHRVNLRLEVSFTLDGEQYQAFTRNLSHGGACIESPASPDVGTPIRLNLELPGVQEPLDIQARVVWVKATPTEGGSVSAGMGVQFIGADASDLAVLESPWSWM